jgi:hypothetical protein
MRIARILISLIGLSLTACGFDLVDIEYNPKTFDKLAKRILDNPQIFQMDDFTRQNKSLNGIPIKLTEADGDSFELLLNKVEDSLGLDSKIVNDLRAQLESTKLREFLRGGDTILFTVDGMLDTSWGFLYSADNLKMDSSWFMFNGNSLLYTKDINKHWKKVAIK